LKDARLESQTNIIWTGYVAKLTDVCKTQNISDQEQNTPNETDKVILVHDPKTETLTAATVDFNSRVCKILQKRGTNEQVYATSDIPFTKVSSEKRFIVLKTALQKE
jgi:hypothetical protein